MSRRTRSPRAPQSGRKPSTVTAKIRHSTVSPHALPPARRAAKPPQRLVPRANIRARQVSPPPKRQVARVMEDAESTLLDVIDNLLAKGVMLNADVILALANVDLVYLRLSALLCAADRVMTPFPKTR